MIKVFITERNNLNENILKKHPTIELINNPKDADFLISQSTIMYPEYAYKTIYIAIEPPRSSHRVWCYSNFDAFKYVYCHNPDPNKPNQFPLNPDDCCQYYPTYPDPHGFNTREDTTIKSRGVFYAGNDSNYDTDACGGKGINWVRKQLGNYFKNNLPGSIIIGMGFTSLTDTKPENWRKDKQTQIMNSDCAFVLALENTVYPNYLYEKIWDGFATDRVTMYLGDPRIEYHIPLNCFIDLRPFVNLEEKTIDFDALKTRLMTMTQEEYDSIISNMRRFRVTGTGKYRYYMDLLTENIIRRMNDSVN